MPKAAPRHEEGRPTPRVPRDAAEGSSPPRRGRSDHGYHQGQLPPQWETNALRPPNGRQRQLPALEGDEVSIAVVSQLPARGGDTKTACRRPLPARKRETLGRGFGPLARRRGGVRSAQSRR